MDEFKQRPLIVRILFSRVFWALLFVVMLVAVLGASQAQLSKRVTEAQTQFVADSVRRGAVQCYAIEGRFPSTQEGVNYLEDNYGLAIDRRRFVVHYESMGDNLIPQIRVIVIPHTSPLDDIASLLGLQNEGR